MYYLYTTAIHIPKYEHPRGNIPGPHIHVSISYATRVYEGQVNLSMVARLMEVWVNVTDRIILGVSVP